MKKLLVLLAIGALVLVGAAAVYADEETPEPPGEGYGRPAWALQNFVDADGDGVCDLRQMIQERGRDRLRTMAQEGTCENFVDADGDGVCDLAGTGAGRMNGARGRMMGQRAGANFVDEDGDGVCDLCGGGQMNSPRGPQNRNR